MTKTTPTTAAMVVAGGVVGATNSSLDSGGDVVVLGSGFGIYSVT